MQNTLIKILKKDFKSFLIKSFYTLHHNQIFSDNWHINLLSQYLEAIAKGEIRRLIINIPPRSLKSICINVAWPAWLLALDPTKKIISASYSQLLSTKHGIDSKKIMQSSWYREFFPASQIIKGENNNKKFVTIHNGFRLSTSIGGTLTGEGGDFLIVDDPLSPMQALSNFFRNRANTWFEQTFYSRLNNQKNGSILVIMQRLHTQDLTGFLLKKNPEDWQVLSLPLIAEEDTTYAIGNFRYNRKHGEFLDQSRNNQAEAEKIQKSLGAYAFAAQYQQHPIAINNGIIKREWIKYFAAMLDFDNIYQSWDCAIKTGAANDFSVCTTWGISKESYYLVNISRTKLEYHELKKALLREAKKYKVDAILIEDKASGQQLIQELSTSGFNVIKLSPKLDKITRLAVVSNVFESGRVFIKSEERWIEDFLMELLSFPNGEHDDQVDSTTQFLQWAENQRRNIKAAYAVRRL